MKVRVLKEHQNDFGVRDGGDFIKKEGKSYVIDDEDYAKILIDAGYVESADKKNADSKG